MTVLCTKFRPVPVRKPHTFVPVTYFPSEERAIPTGMRGYFPGMRIIRRGVTIRAMPSEKTTASHNVESGVGHHFYFLRHVPFPHIFGP